MPTSNLSYVRPSLDLPASSKILLFTDLSLEGGGEGSMPCTSLECGASMKLVVLVDDAREIATTGHWLSVGFLFQNVEEWKLASNPQESVDAFVNCIVLFHTIYFQRSLECCYTRELYLCIVNNMIHILIPIV